MFLMQPPTQSNQTIEAFAADHGFDESAMTTRHHNEYFMPSVPLAMPSDMVRC
jgi:hypothetical protein